MHKSQNQPQKYRPQLSPDRLRRSRNSGGFILVAVLLLIALAVVLVVTTSSVSEIQRKSVSNSTKEELARENALFALNLAVAQLQSAAGPDQRVTATADILNSNSATPSTVAQPYWTGVWKSYNPAWSNSASPWFRPQPLDVDTNGNTGTTTTSLRPWSTATSNVTWLVSGATNNTTISPLYTTTNWMTNSIMMASNWGTGTNWGTGAYGANGTNATTVLVPAVTIKNGTTNTGRYAYWVSDEGVKAKITLTDTNMTNTYTGSGLMIPSLLHTFAPPATQASTALNLLLGTSTINDLRANTNLTKLSSLAQFPLVSNSISNFTNNNILSADLTPYSYGVLSDTRMGGLRQDLTAAFESTSASGASNFTLLQARSGSGTGNDAGAVYSAGNVGIPALLTNVATIASNSTTIFDGARWVGLYNFYNYYKAVTPINPTTRTPLSGSNPAGLGTPNTSSTAPSLLTRLPQWNETNASYRIGALTPNEIADRIDTAITAYTNVVITTNSTNTYYQFRVQYFPLIAMHNPYPVNLTISSGTTFSLSKNCLGTQVTLTCGTNVITNAIWHITTYTTNVSGGVTNIVTNTGVTVTNTLTNLFPYQDGGSATNPDFSLFQGSNYPISQTCTNITTLAPGEIRLFALGGIPATSSVSMGAACAFGALSSSNVSLDAYQYFNAPWQGTTNPNDSVSLSIPIFTNNVGYYNEYRFFGNGSGVNAWPGSTPTYGFAAGTPGVLIPSANGTATNAWTNIAIGTMANNNLQYRILGIVERLKGIYSSGDPNFINSSFYAPMMMGNCGIFNSGRTGSISFGGSGASTTEVYGKSGNQISSLTNLFQDNIIGGPGGTETTCWGVTSAGATTVDTTGSSANNSSLVLRDIPIAPMTSLGQFMQLDDWYFNLAYTSYGVPYMSIGGSFAAPDISTLAGNIKANGYAAGTGANQPNVDNSYLANEALFDTYFFSTVPPQNGFSWGSGAYGAFTNTLSTSSIAANAPLPNSRMVYYHKNGTNPTVTSLQNESTAAANLLVNGAFNINSTSIPAWKALLGSLAGQSFSTYNYLTKTYGNVTLPNGYPYPIPRFWSVSRTSPNDPWDGMRALSDTQLTALATEIVKQVRLRGPFLSMGDFLNRRMGTSTNQLTTMGAVQAAIENTQTNLPASTYDVNYNIHSAANLGQAVNVTGVSSIATNSAVGIPGYLMQQDIIQAFAPVMTARSDTFVIRVYGEADKPTTGSTVTTNSQAWGEAVVQRVPEFIDQTDSALTTASVTGVINALGDATPLRNSSGYIVNTANQNFGRRFKIISFRWLNQNEL